jgi:membrane-bound lytic murein transglycosylase D
MGMKTLCLLTLPLALSPCASAQGDAVTLPEVIQFAQQWAQDNLDTNLLNTLPELDQPKARQLLRDLQQRFQGEYIVDLAPLRQAAEAALPLLEANAGTQPYAAWLRPRLDYLQIADEFRLLIPPPPVRPGEPPQPIPNPPQQAEREIWIKKVAARPWPAAARDYVPQLKPIFAGETVPPELIWLAEVESSFDARARSPAGARGLFQLMPDTARRFGLSLWPRDQRLNPDLSARASAQYLRYLHDRFADWRLALAAYNAGEGTVRKLLERHKAGSYDDIAAHLPAETQLFVPKVEALLLLREKVALANLSSPPGESDRRNSTTP